MSLADVAKIAAKRGAELPKILTLDIETSPNLAHVWGLWNQNVGLNQLLESGRVIAFAAKWYDGKDIEFHSDHHNGHDAMIARANDLLCEADIVVHYNGDNFDLRHLRTEINDLYGAPPVPVRSVDLLKVVKKEFRYPSNKLDYVTRRLGIAGKVGHTGHQLWIDCVLRNDPKAWALMKRYNVQDVRITERLYDRLRPWISNHPHIGLWTGEEWSCNKCGSTKLVREGRTTTALTAYAQYRCTNCGGYSRMNHKKAAATMRGVR